MIIRAARTDDAEPIVAILNDIIDRTTITFTTTRKTAEDIAAEISQRGPAYQVAEMETAVVGLATYFPFRAGPGYVRTREHSIVLAPQAQGRGAGRALMSALADVARAEGVHSLMAGVSGENAAGIAFHAAVGFVEVGRLPEVGYKFDRWLDLVLMQKIL